MDNGGGGPGIIKLQTRKPDPVSKLSFIWPQHCCCDLSAYPPIFASPPSPKGLRRVQLGEQPSETGLHGISACKVYPSCTLLHMTVSSYLTFSLSPSMLYRRRTFVKQDESTYAEASADEGNYFLWHYLLVLGTTRLLTGASLCAVRTFLGINCRDSSVCS